MKKRVLVIFFRPPYPPIGGDKIRMYQNLRFLSQAFHIDVLYINDATSDRNLIDNISHWCQKVINFDITRSKSVFNTLIGFVLNLKPLQVNYFYHKKVQDWIDENLKNYDAVFVNTVRSSEYVIDKKIYKMIDFIDAISMNYEKAIVHKKMGLWKLLYSIDKKRLFRYEKKVLEKFDKHLIISSIDKKHILKDDTKNTFIEVIPNSVNVRKIDKKINEERDISFLGKMDYEPNETAVIYFVNEVFPIIKKSITNINFNIIGIRPTKRIIELGKNEGVHVLGYVEYFEEHILKSKLIVAPMISGAGVQNKILQAMALEKCVITTSIGAEGLPNIKEHEIVISNTPIDMARTVVAMYNDDKMRNSIGTNAKKYIDTNFSEDKIKKKFLNYILSEL